MKSTGLLLYLLVFLQSLFMLLVIGGISSNEYPWNPANVNDKWATENRLYRMGFGIIDITSAFFMVIPFYQILRILREGHAKVVPDLFQPMDFKMRIIRNLLVFVLCLGYLGVSAYL
jgi:hypothetical protein